MQLDDILKFARTAGASDIHIKAGLPPVYRIDGELKPLTKAPHLTQEMTHEMAYKIMDAKQRQRYEDIHEIDMAYGVAGLGRFRVNIFAQRGAVSMVFRFIPFDIKNLDDLILPPVIKKIIAEKRGLVLVTGATGSGKSTTLAAMIDYINNHSTTHIVTIEDPIEFLHRDRRSIINQREVGTDTDNYANALRSALRQDPDVILLGEMRDIETMEIAMHAAETGHLVFSTLHTIDAGESINRIVGSFPPHHQRQIRAQLSATLKAVISQRLIPRIDGKGRVPAVEVMISTARVRELINDANRTNLLAESIQQGYISYGMQSFDQSLMSLVKRNLVSYEEAVAQSSNPDDFKLKFSGISSSSDLSWDNFDTPADEKNGDKDKKIERF